MHYLIRTCCLSALFILGGCSLLSPKPAPAPIITDNWQSHQAQLSQLTHWSLNGKIGIRLSDNSQSATLFWQQQNDHYDLQLTGPLGQGGASISGSPGNIQLRLSEQEQYSASSPQALMDEVMGWSVPVERMHWWVRGIPAPDSAFKHTLQNNRLQILNQDGWQVEYLRYAQQDGYTLPAKLRLERDDLRITLVIKQWSPDR